MRAARRGRIWFMAISQTLDAIASRRFLRGRSKLAHRRGRSTQPVIFEAAGGPRSRWSGSLHFPQRERGPGGAIRSEEHTSELQSLMRISYAVFCSKKKKKTHT